MEAPELDGDAALPREASESSRLLEGIDIDILGDGTVRLHTACKPGQDPAECAERVQFLVEALGLSLDAVVTEVTPPPVTVGKHRRPDL